MNKRPALIIFFYGLMGCVISTVSSADPCCNDRAISISEQRPADNAMQTVNIAPLPDDQMRAPAGMLAAMPTSYPSTASTTSPTASDVIPEPAAKGYSVDQSQPVKEGLGGIISELRLGAVNHDVGPFSSNKEDGIDANLEILLLSPQFLGVLFSPRPHIGLTINTQGNTSLAYFGLSWEWTFWNNWFAGFSGGGSVHDGKLSTVDTDRKELGCRILFRTTVEAGYRFGGRHSLSGIWSHNSNANICDKNEGLENVGIRYGYRF